jgi:Pvc16 N-terminal domain
LAEFHAIQVTCDAVMRLLQESYRPDLIEPSSSLQFEVYGTEDFKSHMAQGVSLFLYRVHVNTTQRSPLVKDPVGNMRRQLLPLDLHCFITVWAPKASLQHAILGWAMRLLEDNPVISSSLLNGVREETFRGDETVELVVGQLTNEELMRIWDDLGTEYQLSVPYVARVVRIESLYEMAEGEPVRQRRFEYGALKGD